MVDRDLEFADKIAKYNFGQGTLTSVLGAPKMDITRVEYGPAASMDQLVMAEAYMQVVADRIKANGHEVPADLADKLDKCSRDLTLRLRSERQNELALLRKQREDLLSADDKRAKLEARITKLEELLK